MKRYHNRLKISQEINKMARIEEIVEHIFYEKKLEELVE